MSDRRKIAVNFGRGLITCYVFVKPDGVVYDLRAYDGSDFWSSLSPSDRASLRLAADRGRKSVALTGA